MIEKKLVEKEVEVTVVKKEKRIVEMFTYGDWEYTKEALKDEFNNQIYWAVRRVLDKRARSQRVLGRWDNLKYDLVTHNVVKEMGEEIYEILQLIKSLDNDVDKDWRYSIIQEFSSQPPFERDLWKSKLT